MRNPLRRWKYRLPWRLRGIWWLVRPKQMVRTEVAGDYGNVRIEVNWLRMVAYVRAGNRTEDALDYACGRVGWSIHEVTRKKISEGDQYAGATYVIARFRKGREVEFA